MGRSPDEPVAHEAVHGGHEAPTLKSGNPGKTKVSYDDPDQALQWLWTFVVDLE